MIKDVLTKTSLVVFFTKSAQTGTQWVVLYTFNAPSHDKRQSNHHGAL